MRRLCFSLLLSILLTLFLSACRERSGSLRLVFSADTWGELEDCACGATPQGGLARRANALWRLRGEGGSPLLLVDGGNLHSGRDTESDLRLARELVSLMGAMRYDLAVMGPRDVALKSGTVRGMLADAAFPVLGGSWSKGRLAMPMDSLWVKEVGGLVVGVVDHVDAGYKGHLRVAGHVEDHLLSRLRLLRPLCDVLVVVAALDPRAPEPLARQLAGLADVLLITGGAPATEHPQDVEGVLVASVGEKGQSLGLLDLTVERGKLARRQWTLLPLDDRYRQDSLVVDRVSRAKDRERAHEGLRREQVRQAELRRLGLKAEDLPGESAGARYAGARACRECHAPIHESWRASAHAGTWAQVLREGREHEILSQRRLVTGWMEKGGWLNYQESPELAGVQCEACHGRGSRHVNSGGRLLDDLASNPAAACASCHGEVPVVDAHSLRH